LTERNIDPKDHIVKTFTDLFSYSNNLLDSHVLTVLRFVKMFSYLNESEYTVPTWLRMSLYS